MNDVQFRNGLFLAKRNLSCAQELPGAERLDIDECLGVLADWACQVERFTHRLMPRFQEAPEQFEGTLPRFLMLCLTTYLQRNLGVGYDQVWKEIPVNDSALFDDSRRLFLHGIIYEGRGTCNSLPVLFAVIGRCLGYPLYLAKAIGHTFVRWEDGCDRFNVEATSPGFRAVEDRHYHHWPKAMKHLEMKSAFLLNNMTEEQENASFFALRGHCLTDNLKFSDALPSYREAQREDPHDPNYQTHALVATLMASLHSQAIGIEVDRNEELVSFVYNGLQGNTRRPATALERKAFPHARRQMDYITNCWAARTSECGNDGSLDVEGAQSHV